MFNPGYLLMAKRYALVDELGKSMNFHGCNFCLQFSISSIYWRARLCQICSCAQEISYFCSLPFQWSSEMGGKPSRQVWYELLISAEHNALVEEDAIMTKVFNLRLQWLGAVSNRILWRTRGDLGSWPGSQFSHSHCFIQHRRWGDYETG